MRTERGLDRLVFFTDAVTAIAITLLILPLVDSVSGTSERKADLFQFLVVHALQLGAFVLSFVVIARLWLAHHNLFEHVKSYSPRLMALNMFWAFTIVLLPLPTAIIAAFSTSWLSTLFYIGTMTLTSTSATIMVAMIRGNPELESETNPVSYRTWIDFLLTSILFVVALVLATTIPAVNFFALLILFVAGPIVRLLVKRHNRADVGGIKHT